MSLQAKIIAKVFQRLDEKFANGQTELLPDDFLQLRTLFGDLLDRALDLLDRCTIVRYQADPTSLRQHHTAQRCILEIASATVHSPTVYKLLPNINYCACSSFKYQVLSTTAGQPQQFTCKHVLACRLAALLQRCRIETVADDQLRTLSEQFARQTLV